MRWDKFTVSDAQNFRRRKGVWHQFQNLRYKRKNGRYRFFKNGKTKEWSQSDLMDCSKMKTFPWTESIGTEHECQKSKQLAIEVCARGCRKWDLYFDYYSWKFKWYEERQELSWYQFTISGCNVRRFYDHKTILVSLRTGTIRNTLFVITKQFSALFEENIFHDVSVRCYLLTINLIRSHTFSLNADSRGKAQEIWSTIELGATYKSLQIFIISFFFV